MHQELHNDFRAIRHRSTRTKDSRYACLIQEIVILGRNYSARSNHYVGTAEFLELLDDLRDEGLVTCRKGGDTQYMDIVLLVGSGDP